MQTKADKGVDFLPYFCRRPLWMTLSELRVGDSYPFSALTLLVGWQRWHQDCKNLTPACPKAPLLGGLQTTQPNLEGFPQNRPVKRKLKEYSCSTVGDLLSSAV